MSRSVAMRPGWTAFTRIPSFARSADIVFSIPCTDARIAFDRRRLRYCVGCRTDVEVEYTIEPLFCLRICGSARRVRRTAEKRVRSTAFCHAASSRSSNRPGGGPPAFTIMMSRAWKDPRAFWTNTSQPSRVARSAAIGRMFLFPVFRWMSSAAEAIADSSRLHIATFAPSRANSSAMARPSPFDAAATSATFPLSPRSIGHRVPRRSPAATGGRPGRRLRLDRLRYHRHPESLGRIAAVAAARRRHITVIASDRHLHVVLACHEVVRRIEAAPAVRRRVSLDPRMRRACAVPRRIRPAARDDVAARVSRGYADAAEQAEQHVREVLAHAGP